MATFDLHVPGELRLILRGADENRVLETLRRWPYWLRAELEHDPVDTTRILTVTLIAGREQEAMLREILRRSFGLEFPAEGGSLELPPAPPPKPARRGVPVRRT